MVHNNMVYSLDVDQDGYDIFEDCDDQNSEINPVLLKFPIIILMKIVMEKIWLFS